MVSIFSLTLPSIFHLEAKINETDTFGPGDDDEIQFDDIGDDDEDIDDVSSSQFTINFSWISFFSVYSFLLHTFPKRYDKRNQSPEILNDVEISASINCSLTFTEV